MLLAVLMILTGGDCGYNFNSRRSRGILPLIRVPENELAALEEGLRYVVHEVSNIISTIAGGKSVALHFYYSVLFFYFLILPKRVSTPAVSCLNCDFCD